MPALEQSMIDDVTKRLARHLKTIGGYDAPQFLKAGGSAAVFRVDSTHGPRAWKAFNPAFLSGSGSEAERRRLQVQRRLIHHTCPSLIQTYRVDEAEETAFMEMEFNPWPELTELIPHIPDANVAPLITQLVDAVRFLESKGIVHRDIKPENINISADFKQLKLLDLGVARDIEPEASDEAGVTDHGHLRPFLATAQYSSPEYLFRLDEPSTRLWKGLNFYQVGAVLHDLIMKKPLFQHEMSVNNRWLVARAVLTKLPSFSENQPNRLSHLKALASRCLVKDLDTRLQLVGWDDFVLEGAFDPLTALQARLKGRAASGGALALASAETRLKFERDTFAKRIIDHVRTNLISSCGTEAPLSVAMPTLEAPHKIEFHFSPTCDMSIQCHLTMEWQSQLYERTVLIRLSSYLKHAALSTTDTPFANKLVISATISEGEEEAFAGISGEIAACLIKGLDLLETETIKTSLHNADLLQELGD